MLDSVERDDIPLDVPATPGPGEGSSVDLLGRLLHLYAAQDTHALADALASLFASPPGSGAWTCGRTPNASAIDAMTRSMVRPSCVPLVK